jgi:ATP-dependent DNA ligase
MAVPLHERKKILDEIITEVPHTLEVVRGFKCFSIDEVLSVFESHVQN